MPETLLNADGSTTEWNDDGSATTSWPDGTTRVDYPNNSSTTTYPDGRVLNVYADGTRDFNDQYGTALDPDTGQPLTDPGPVVDPPASAEQIVTDVLHGAHTLSSLAEAAGMLGHAEVLELVGESADGVIAVAVMTFEVWKALEAANRAYATAGYCYGLMYGALDLEGPDYPAGTYSLDNDETIAIKKEKFAEGVSQARTELAAGADGVLLRNKILLRTAARNSDPAVVIDEIWQACCRATENEFYASHLRLMWPDTGITER
jgi:hypothetical protein